MQRIIINENDLTSNVEINSSYDVAYVPGFMVVGDDNAEDYYRKPKLFTNKYAFTSAIGSTPATFVSEQQYPVWTNGDADGFPARAIPDSGVMFAEGDADLGYRIALYLLSLGIPVYYEVMNNANATGASDNYSINYKYTKVDTTTAVFNPDATYYTYRNADDCTVTKETEATFTSLEVDKKTFGEAVEAVPNTYVFIATGVEEESGSDDESAVTLEWSYEGQVIDPVLYGITATMAAPVLGEEYEVDFILSYNYQAVYGTDEESADPTDFVVVPAETTAFGTEPFYTVSTKEHCPNTLRAMYEGLKARFVFDTGEGHEGEASVYSSFDNMGDYSIKYITSGGYPTFEYADKAGATDYALMQGLINTASTRSDSIALIDHTNNPTRDLFPSTLGGSGDSVLDIMRTVGANISNASYGAMFTPWYSCTHGAITANAKSNFVPGSVGYLSALAIQIRDYNPWLAVSGVTRGKVPNLTVSDSATTQSLHTVEYLTNSLADAYQTIPYETSGAEQISINPITYIRNTGYCIWGNRTLRNNDKGTSALSFLNIRGMVCDIKKLLYTSAQNMLFEQNTDVTWFNFKSNITPLLDRMVSNYILTDYSITRYLIDPETGEAVPAYKVLAVIRIQPINSIEVFDLTVQLENAEVTVSEM